MKEGGRGRKERRAPDSAAGSHLLLFARCEDNKPPNSLCSMSSRKTRLASEKHLQNVTRRGSVRILQRSFVCIGGLCACVERGGKRTVVQGAGIITGSRRVKGGCRMDGLKGVHGLVVVWSFHRSTGPAPAPASVGSLLMPHPRGRS